MFLCSAIPGNECQLVQTPISEFDTYHECAYYGYDYYSYKYAGNYDYD